MSFQSSQKFLNKNANQHIQHHQQPFDREQSKKILENVIISSVKKQFEETANWANMKNDQSNKVEGDFSSGVRTMKNIEDYLPKLDELQNKFQTKKLPLQQKQNYQRIVYETHDIFRKLVEEKKQFPVKVNQAFTTFLGNTLKICEDLKNDLVALESQGVCSCTGSYRKTIADKVEILRQYNQSWTLIYQFEAREGYQETYHAPKFQEQPFRKNIQNLLEQNMPYEQQPQLQIQYIDKPTDQLRLAHELLFGFCTYQDISKAMEIYYSESDKGNCKALNSLGQIYFEGTIYSTDIKKSLQYYEKSAMKGDSEAWYRIGMMIEYGYGKNYPFQILDSNQSYPNIIKAIKCYEKASEDSHLNALTDLGYIFENGVKDDEDPKICRYSNFKNPNSNWIIKPDFQRAIQYLEIAKKAKFPRAMNILGRIYLQQNQGQDYLQKAVKLFQNAADLGYAKAYFNLGLCYEKGNGVQQNLEKALSLFREGAEKGDIDCKMFFAFYVLKGATQLDSEEEYRKAASYLQDVLKENPQKDEAYYFLGFLYENGLGVNKDYKIAFRYFYNGAAKGNAQCANRCGDFLFSGYGVEHPDQAEAIKFYQEAAQKNNCDALINLGTLYEEGKAGLIQDYKKAVEYYQKAADYGDSQALINLAYLYDKGLYFKADKEEANNLYRKAADMGNSKAREILSNRGVAFIDFEIEFTDRDLERPQSILMENLSRGNLKSNSYRKNLNEKTKNTHPMIANQYAQKLPKEILKQTKKNQNYMQYYQDNQYQNENLYNDDQEEVAITKNNKQRKSRR